MDKSKFYLDLSKCTEEEQRHAMKLVNFKMGYDNTVPYLMFFEKRIVGFSDVTMGKTEITYPEFIKLFEGGEGEMKVDIYSGELNTERILTYKKLSEQYNIEESTVRDIFNAGADWVNKLKFK